MGEAILVQKNAVIKTPNPIINITSVNYTSTNVRLTNTHNQPVTIYYELDNAVPNANTINVAANDFEDITFSSLTSNTTFTLYVYAKENGQLDSDILDAQFTTLKYTTQAPTINVTNIETDEVTFTLTNNDTSTVTMYYEVNDSTPDITATVSGGATITRTIGSLSEDTDYTLYARAQASNENMSSTVSEGFKTNADVSYLNGLNYQWYTHTSSTHPNTQSEFDTFISNASEQGSGIYTGTINFGNASQSGAGGTAGPKPSYLPADRYAWAAQGYIYAPETGTYEFGIDGDDAIDLFINGQRVAYWYGGHGFQGGWTGGTRSGCCNQFQSSINLQGGNYYTFSVRMEEVTGGDGLQVGWKKPSDSSISLIPASSYFIQIGGASQVPSNALFYFNPNDSASYSGSGTTLTDLSPNGNNFTLNGVSFITDGGLQVFDFNSTGDSINGSLDLRRSWSFEIWVKQLQTDPITFLGQGPTSSNQGLHIWQYSNNDIRFGMYSNDRDAVGISTSTNVWYQYVFTYNHSTREKKIYRNSLRIDNSTVSGPNQYTGTGTLRIGQIYSTTSQNRDSRKRVGEMIMYDYPLSDTDVSDSYNLRRGLYGI